MDIKLDAGLTGALEETHFKGSKDVASALTDAGLPALLKELAKRHGAIDFSAFATYKLATAADAQKRLDAAQATQKKALKPLLEQLRSIEDAARKALAALKAAKTDAKKGPAALQEIIAAAGRLAVALPVQLESAVGALEDRLADLLAAEEEAARQQAAKDAKEGKPDAGPMELSKPFLLLRKKAIEGLRLVKNTPPAALLEKPVCYLVAVGAKACRVYLARSVGGAQRNLLKGLMPGEKGIKYFTGNVIWEAKAHTFVGAQMPGGFAKRVQRGLLEQTKGKFRVRARKLDGDGGVDEEAGADDPDRIDDTSGEVADKPAAPNAPPKSTQQRLADLKARFAKLKPDLDAALAANGPKADAIRQTRDLIERKLKEGKPDPVQTLIGRLEDVVLMAVAQAEPAAGEGKVDEYLEIAGDYLGSIPAVGSADPLRERLKKLLDAQTKARALPDAGKRASAFKVLSALAKKLQDESRAAMQPDTAVEKVAQTGSSGSKTTVRGETAKAASDADMSGDGPLLKGVGKLKTEKQGGPIKAKVTTIKNGRYLYDFAAPLSKERVMQLIFTDGALPGRARLEPGKGQGQWILETVDTSAAAFDMEGHQAVLSKMRSRVQTVDPGNPTELIEEWPEPSDSLPEGPKNKLGFWVNKKYDLDHGQLPERLVMEKLHVSEGAVGYEVIFVGPMSKADVMKKLFVPNAPADHIILLPVPSEPSTMYQVQVVGSVALGSFNRAAMSEFGYNPKKGLAKETQPEVPDGMRGHIAGKSVPKGARKLRPDIYVWEDGGLLIRVETDAPSGGGSYYRFETTKIGHASEAEQAYIRQLVMEKGMHPKQAWEEYGNRTVEMIRGIAEGGGVGWVPTSIGKGGPREKSRPKAPKRGAARGATKGPGKPSPTRGQPAKAGGERVSKSTGAKPNTADAGNNAAGGGGGKSGAAELKPILKDFESAMEDWRVDALKLLEAEGIKIKGRGTAPPRVNVIEKELKKVAKDRLSQRRVAAENALNRIKSVVRPAVAEVNAEIGAAVKEAKGRK